MKFEIGSIFSNQVWTFVDPAEEVLLIGNKWIYKRKPNLEGKAETYKARLLAKGYVQRERIDFDDTFSAVAKTKSICILLAIAAHLDYDI